MTNSPTISYRRMNTVVLISLIIASKCLWQSKYIVYSEPLMYQLNMSRCYVDIFRFFKVLLTYLMNRDVSNISSYVNIDISDQY